MGFILFARNLSEPEQIRDLVASLKDSIGRPDAPVLIDQEGGRVQRIRAPHVEAYPPAARLGEVYEADRGAGLRAAWLMSRLHAFDLTRLGITVNCLPVLDVLVEVPRRQSATGRMVAIRQPSPRSAPRHPKG